jgi:hypothetical protein
MQIQQMPIEALIPYIRNPRKNDEQVDRMCGAIREFGFRIPVVAKSDGSVIDGHLRLKAAVKLGLKTVPVAIADELTDAQIKAFRLALQDWMTVWGDKIDQRGSRPGDYYLERICKADGYVLGNLRISKRMLR